ncbi:MAG: Hsp33 family molecular chaperone HslO [Deltaproteobacteria bacterium]|nr:Hsp33 family molecular chaperone HslO [Deltaproteobacteria bacterium]MBW2137363.1 Hsp33 family molecular chaperone HslO [Deltaproteobacteria bacterium]
MEPRFSNTLKPESSRETGDRLCNFLLASGAARGVILNGTRMIQEMGSSHVLGILETMVLGRAYLGTALMAADLKGRDRIVVKIDCSGPVRGLVAEANAFGEVRGYLKRIPIPVNGPLEDFDLAPFFGEGILSVTRYLQNAKHPFTGQVGLKYGNIALDLANYYLESEQIPTAFNLGIKLNRQGEVTGAGGLLLQTMPDTSDSMAADLEERVSHLPSLGVFFSQSHNPRDLVEEVFESYSPQYLVERHIEFRCHCNRERLRVLLTLMDINELKDILETGPFPLEVRCHYCGTVYRFSEVEIRRIYGMRNPDN